MKLAPVVIFVYARPIHTVKTIESLAKNVGADKTDVFIFCDLAKTEKAQESVRLVREYIDKLEDRNLFKSLHIVKAPENKGLANSVISGVTQILQQYDKVIVLEDDLVSAPDFLQYMNEALGFFKNDNRIWSICGYTFEMNLPTDYKHDIYLSYRGGSWGWATWRERWQMVDWDVADYDTFKHDIKLRAQFNRGGRDLADMLDAQMGGKIDSWAIRWCYSQSMHNMFTVYPTLSRIKNIGLDGSGTHSGVSFKYDTPLSDGLNQCRFGRIEPDRRIVKMFRDHFGNEFDYFVLNLKKCIKRFIGKGRSLMQQEYKFFWKKTTTIVFD